MGFSRLLMIAFCAAAATMVDSSSAPNVIIVLVDDLGTADVSFSSKRLNGGFAAIDTPGLDSLATGAGGIQLTKSYTHMLCGPSRSALITGRLAHTLGNPFAMPLGGSLATGVGTVAHEFKKRGYSTHFVGKWGIDYHRPSDEVMKMDATHLPHLKYNGNEEGKGPEARGFETFYGLYGSGHNHFTKEVVFKGAIDWHRHNATHRLDYPDVDHEPTEYSTHLFTREAIRVIDTWSAEAPGFLHLSYTAPHDPLQAPDEYLNIPQCAQMQNWRRRTFCGMVKAMDEGVAQVTEALQKRGLADNTIIIFSTDNGGAPSVGGFNYPFRGEKASVYEGGIHNPAFINIPPALGATIRSGLYERTSHLVDFAPTLLGLADRFAGRDSRDLTIMGTSIDGVDHTEYLLSSLGSTEFDITDKPSPRTATVLEFNALMGHSAYLEGDWKLVLGNAGRSITFREPTGRYFDEDGRNRYVSEEIFCDMIESFGENYFVYGWIVRMMLDAVWPNPNNDGSQKEMLKAMRLAEFGDGVEIVEGNLPRADWSKYDMEKVQLFNLQIDPLEARNVALDNAELVDAMAARMREFVRNDPPHQLSVQKKFVQFGIEVMKCTAAAIAAAFAVAAVALLKGMRPAMALCVFFGCACAASVLFAIALTRICLACLAVFIYRTSIAPEPSKEKTV